MHAWLNFITVELYQLNTRLFNTIKQTCPEISSEKFANFFPSLNWLFSYWHFGDFWRHKATIILDPRCSKIFCQ